MTASPDAAASAGAFLRQKRSIRESNQRDGAFASAAGLESSLSPLVFKPMDSRKPSAPHVVIVGGGFAGLTAARTLRHAPVQITLIDRHNHHVFQPLLYQVATAGLSSTNIAAV